PERPITTNTSPHPTSKLTLRTATAHPVFFLMSCTLSRSMDSSQATSEALVPKTFHKPWTLNSASLRGVGGAVTAVGALSVWIATKISLLLGLLSFEDQWGSGSAPEPPFGLWIGVLPDVFDLAVFVEADVTEFAAVAGTFHSAPLGLRHVGVVIVDPDG